MFEDNNAFLCILPNLDSPLPSPCGPGSNIVSYLYNFFIARFALSILYKLYFTEPQNNLAN